MSTTDAAPSQTAVLIVGGGPVGLTASTLLSQHGIENVVVERRSDTQRAPAAHVLRPRPMEVFGRIGVADEIRRSKPELALDYITWCTAFGGTDLGRIDLHDGAVSEDEVWTNCPQNILEPILLARARRESAARIFTGAECTRVEQDDDRVRAAIRYSDGGEIIIEARWLIAADGAGSPVRKRVGIPMVGPGPQGNFFMIHFEADLRPFMKDREGPLYFVVNPAAAGCFIVHDPAKSTVYMAVRTGAEGEEETLQARLETALGVSANPRIVSTDSWSPFVQVAESYRKGRIFLAGDAAHRFPPTGGLGLNTGILDVDFLVHQLSKVERGERAEILDAYEAECRPVAQQNATDSFDNMKRMAEISAALGPFSDVAALETRLASLTDQESANLAQAIENQRSHFTSNGKLPPDPHQTSS
jgi:2,4-dichlorophenol 6-monooxygenase